MTEPQYALYLPTENGEGSQLYWLREKSSPLHKSITLVAIARMTCAMMKRYGYDGDAKPRVVRPIATGQEGVWMNGTDRIEAETADVLFFSEIVEKCIDHADSLL